MATKEQVRVHRKYLNLTENHEDGNIFLINNYNRIFNEMVGDSDYPENDWDLETIMKVLQEYIDTGGDEAGEFVYAVYNVREFIKQKFTPLVNTYIIVEHHKLFPEGFFEWCINMYETWLNYTTENRLLIDLNTIENEK